MDSTQAAVIRITALTASPEYREQLIAAAWQNAIAARSQSGCLSADVAIDPDDPDRVSVISRWRSEQHVQAFLDWHRTIAHESLREFAVAPPASVHHVVDPHEAFAAAWRAWHDAHERERAAEHGFLAITAAHWLSPEPQRFDDAPGRWSAGGQTPQLVVDEGEHVELEGRTLQGDVRLPAPAPGAPTLLHWHTGGADVLVEVARFGESIVVRPRHPDAATRTSYTGTPAYEPDERFVVEAEFVPFEQPRQVSVDTVVDGLETVFDAPGRVRFDLDGPRELTAFGDGEGMRLLFTDRTSGVTTYPASRNLHIDAPDDRGRVRIDFNRATNLPCAYTSSAMCPLPPAENRLDVAVEAGEKMP